MPAGVLAFDDREIPPEMLMAEVDDVAWSMQRIDLSGPPRTFSTELRAQTSRIDDGPYSTTRWVLARGTLDTPNFGFLSVDAAYGPDGHSDAAGTYRTASRASISLSQRLLPLAGGWFATSGLGLIQPGHVDMVSQQYRFGVPTRTVLGASTMLSNEASGLQMSLASGTPVALDPVGQAGFADLGGRATTLGFGARAGRSGWRYAVEASDYRQGAMQTAGPGGLDPSTQAVMQVLRQDGGGGSVQFNALSSRNSANVDAGWRTGYWVDGSLQSGAVEHRFGLNDLPEEQRWLGVAVPSGARGGYYRWRWRTRQSLLEAQIDEQRLSGAPDASSTHTTQLWMNGRFQQDQMHALGLQSVVTRVGDATGINVLGFRETAVGDTSWRLLAGVAIARDQPDQYQLGGEVTATQSSIQWNGSLSAFSNGGAKLGTDLAMSAAQNLTERASFVLGLRRYNAIDVASAGTSVNASLLYRLTPAWTLTGALSESRGARGLRPVGASSGPPSLDSFVTYTPRLRYGLITLRYEWQAGSPTVPLGGGATRAGGGRVEGAVFLDTNGNGRVDPGEASVANVLVILDGRYSVRTDPQGRYAFPFVASGEHKLRILPDNIPLPWSVADMSDRRIEVEPRTALVTNFGATRN